MKVLFSILFLCLFINSFAQPANNLCSNATSVTPDGTCYNGTTTGAADNISGEAGCATQGGPNNHRDVWYSFTATSATVEFDITSPSGSTIELLLLSGACGSNSLENSTCMTSPLNSTFSGLTIGQTYYYVVSFPGNTQTTFITCVTSVLAPPAAGQNCTTAQPICSNSSFGGNSDGYGTQELNNSNQGCLLSNERQSSWYYFQIQSSGTLDMTIDPTNNVDYDFGLYGPFATYACPITSSPIRCSYASGITTLNNTGSYNTGFGPTGTEDSDGTSGTLDGWASTMNVIAGQYYILVVDNFQVDNTPFTLSWGGSSILSCALLMPVELVEFIGIAGKEYNRISWTTLSEESNDFFTLERSFDGSSFEPIHEIPGAGNSNVEKNYSCFDYRFKPEQTNYYRLKQTDFNGKTNYSSIITVNNQSEQKVISEFAVDFTGRKSDITHLAPGLYVIVTEFNDHSVVTKKIRVN